MMHANHNDFYQAMGYPDRFYDRATKTFDVEKIKEKIEQINEQNVERYARVHIDTNSLDFENLQSFNFTLLLQITKLDFRKRNNMSRAEFLAQFKKGVIQIATPNFLLVPVSILKTMT